MRNDRLAKCTVPHTEFYTRIGLHMGGLQRRTEWNAGSVHNLTRQEEKEEERKCVLLASQPEHLSPPGKDSDSVVEP